MVSISCKNNPSERKRKGKILKKLLPFYFSSRSSHFLQKMKILGIIILQTDGV